MATTVPELASAYNAFVAAHTAINDGLTTKISAGVTLTDAKLLAVKTFKEDIKILKQWIDTLVNIGTVDDLEDCYIALPKTIEKTKERVASIINTKEFSDLADLWNAEESAATRVMNDSMLYAFPILKKMSCIILDIFKNNSTVKVDTNSRVISTRPMFSKSDTQIVQEQSYIFKKYLQDLYDYISSEDVKYPEDSTTYDKFTDKLDSLQDRKAVIDAIMNNCYPGMTQLSGALTYNKIGVDTTYAVKKAGQTWKTIKDGLTGGGTLLTNGFEDVSTMGSIDIVIDILNNYLKCIIGHSAWSSGSKSYTAGLSDLLDAMRATYINKDKPFLKFKNELEQELSQTLKGIDLVREFRDEALTQYREWIIKALRTSYELQRHVVFYKQGDDADHDWLTSKSAYASSLSEIRNVINGFIVEDVRATTAHNIKDDSYDVYTTIDENKCLPIASKNDVLKLYLAAKNIDALINWVMSTDRDEDKICNVPTFNAYSAEDRSKLTAVGAKNNSYNMLSYSPSFDDSDRLIDRWGDEDKEIEVYRDINAAMHGYTPTGDTSKKSGKTYFVIKNGLFQQASTDDFNGNAFKSGTDYYEKWMSGSEWIVPVNACSIPNAWSDKINELFTACCGGASWSHLNFDEVRLVSVYIANLLKVKVKICNVFKTVWETANDNDNRNETTITTS